MFFQLDQVYIDKKFGIIFYRIQLLVRENNVKKATTKPSYFRRLNLSI